MKLTRRFKKILRTTASNATLERHIRCLQNLLLLPCSLGVGLVPPLLWLFSISLWQRTTLPFTNAIPLTAAALLLSPFTAGFAHARQRPQDEVIGAALPAFLLWLAAVALYSSMFNLPNTRTLATTLPIALLAGIGGAMSAQRIADIKPKIAQKKKASTL